MEAAMAERRHLDRRQFSYYMRVIDESTGQLLGHLTDISASGFKLDCQKVVPINKRYVLHLDLNSEVSTKQLMVFSATSRWCRPDRLDPTSFNVGFEILEMTPGDMDIFVRMFEKYGSPNKNSDKSSSNFSW
jgi:hypothetical protein